MKNQPEWRKQFVKKYQQAIKEYAAAPMEIKIDPNLCPMARRYNWELYGRNLRRNPNILNFPKLPMPSTDEPYIEAEFVDVLDGVIEKY